jgi:apolipoprotein N-acyltransferase
MAFAVDPRRFRSGALAVATSSVLLWFGTGLDPWWPLLWFAPLPVLVFAARASWAGAALVAALAWLLGLLNLWHYLTTLPLPVGLLVGLFGGPTVAFSLTVLLYRALLRRGRYGLAILAFPAAWVAFEYLTNLVSPHGTVGSLAYTQLALSPVLQLASVTGPWGLTFVVLGFSAALAVAWQVRDAPARAARIVGATVGAIAAVLAFGALRLAGGAAGPTVAVGLIASDPPISPQIAQAGPATAALFSAYLRSAHALAAQGAQVIVLPEKLGVTVDPINPDVDAQFQALADATRALIVVGMIRIAPPAAYNEARIYAPGAPVRSYHKQHMLTPFESTFQPGTELALVPAERGSWGVQICKDMDFTQPSRDYGRAGVGLMLVPAWDFVIDGRWHGHMARMRGVESGFSVVRAGKQGQLMVSDNRGRILAELASDAAPFTTLRADVPTGHAETLYLRLGDWFAWLALAGLGGALATLIRRPRPARRADRAAAPS